MERPSLSSSSARWAVRLLVLAAALTIVACDNSVNFSPTEPEWPIPGSGRNVQISGSLTAEAGACLEATVLYDGKELPGARAKCSVASGCAKLELDALAVSAAGHHRISFKVLRQSAEAVEYLAEGTARVSRDGISLGGVHMPLGPTRATLRPGEAVTFEVDFSN